MMLLCFMAKNALENKALEKNGGIIFIFVFDPRGLKVNFVQQLLLFGWLSHHALNNQHTDMGFICNCRNNSSRKQGETLGGIQLLNQPNPLTTMSTKRKVVILQLMNSKSYATVQFTREPRDLITTITVMLLYFMAKKCL